MVELYSLTHASEHEGYKDPRDISKSLFVSLDEAKFVLGLAQLDCQARAAEEKWQRNSSGVSCGVSLSCNKGKLVLKIRDRINFEPYFGCIILLLNLQVAEALSGRFDIRLQIGDPIFEGFDLVLD